MSLWILRFIVNLLYGLMKFRGDVIFIENINRLLILYILKLFFDLDY